MSNIVLTKGVRQNLLALQGTAALMSTTQNRLATGRKVNTALDNPLNFFTSSALTARASDLGAILDSMTNGIKTLEAADNGLTSITKTVTSMQATINQAREDQSWQGASYTVDGTAIGTATAKNLSISGGLVTGTINVALQSGTGGTQAALSTQVPYANVTPAATSPVLTGSSDFAALDATNNDETYTFTVNGNAVTLDFNDDLDNDNNITLDEAIIEINNDLNLTNFRARNNAGKLEFYLANGATGSGQTITIAGLGNGGTSPSATTSFGLGAGASQSGTNATSYSFTVSDGTTTNAITLTAAASDTLANAITSVNTQLGPSNTFEAYDNGGRLGIREKVAGGKTLTIAGADSAALFGATLANTGAAGGLTVKTVDQLVDAINADVSLAGKVRASNNGGKLRIENLSTIDLTVAGATSTTVTGAGASTQTIGGNTVRKNLITQFNVLRDQLDKIADDASFNGINLLKGDMLTLTFNEMNTSSITIQSDNTSGVNVDTLAIGTASDLEFSSASSLETRLIGLRNTLSSLRSQASTFGSKLSIVQNREDFTKMMINTLETGADSLTLADSNEEGANMLALQTRQQLSTTALSLSAQADQAVLRLFG
jgi:flagellin